MRSAPLPVAFLSHRCLKLILIYLLLVGCIVRESLAFAADNNVNAANTNNNKNNNKNNNMRTMKTTVGAARATSSSTLGSDVSGLTDAPSFEEDSEIYNLLWSADVSLSDAMVSNGILSVTRSTRDVDADTRRNYLYTIPIPQGQGFFPFTIPPTELSENIVARIPSPSGDKLLILRKGATEKDEQVFEIWTNGAESLIQRIQLSKKLHGKVVNEPAGFGSLSWNADETAVVYAAERHFDHKLTSFLDSGDDDATPTTTKPIVGAQHELGYGQQEKWGEKYTKVSGIFDLFVVYIETGKVAKVQNVPASDGITSSSSRNVSSTSTGSTSSLGGYTLGQASFSPCGTNVVYTAWDAGGGDEMPRRLGMIYCYNRPSKVYASPVKKLMQDIGAVQQHQRSANSRLLANKDGDYLCLTPNFRMSRSPRFSPVRRASGLSQLCYLSSPQGFDTHDGVMSLHAMDWDVKLGKPVPTSAKVLVESELDPVRHHDSNTVHVANMCFPGLFVSQLPLSCCSSDHIYTTTQWGSVKKVVRIGLSDGKVSLVNVDIIRSSGQSTESLASQQLLYVDMDGGMVIVESAPNRPAIVGYVSPQSLMRSNVSRKVEGALVAEMGPIAASSFCRTAERDTLRLLNFNYEVLLMNMSPDEMGGSSDAETPVQWIFLKPPNVRNPPLIVCPHGGPHSCTPTTYIPSYAYLCCKGYAVLHVNYRGSTGFGQRALESLPGQAGHQDVKDLIHAVETVSEAGWVDRNRIGICGGSHGGFLASHCIGQYPKLFKCAAMRNPVTNIASMTTTTDIMDWCFVEALGCGYYNPRKFRAATADELTTMWNASPVRYVDNVVAPTLVALGMSDKRVPPSQGLEYYHSLRSNGVKTKLLMYDDDDHAIDKVKSEADLWINIKRWFDEHL